MKRIYVYADSALTDLVEVRRLDDGQPFRESIKGIEFGAAYVGGVLYSKTVRPFEWRRVRGESRSVENIVPHGGF